MKICCTCKQEKSVSEYNKNQDRCRDCCKAWYKQNIATHRAKVRKGNNERADRNRLVAWTYLENNPCSQCGYSNILALEFHHLDKTLKTENITRLVTSGVSVKRLMEEIEKCVVLCANCHRIETAYQLGWKKANR